MARRSTIYPFIRTVLLIALGLVVYAEAQATSNVTCMSSFNWAFNSKQQSPCLVGAYLSGACNGGVFSVDSLPANHHYNGPTPQSANQCLCSTVTYSLLSACGACQNRTVLSWVQWAASCSTIYDAEFVEEIPANTSVPHWAYLDVLAAGFNAQQAQAAGDSPESTAAQSTSGTGASATASNGNEPTPVPPGASTSGTGSTSSSSKSNAGPIAGGVVGGIVGLALIGGAIAFFLVRRRRNRATYAHTPSTGTAIAEKGGAASPPPGSYSQTSGMRSFSPDRSVATPPPRFYNPSDPSTFPTPRVSSPLASISETNLQNGRTGGAQYTGVPEV